MTTHHQVTGTFTMKDGKHYIIRRPTEDDAESIINYSKLLFTSTDQLLTVPEEYTITIENEKMWINSASKTADVLLLVAELEEKIVGFLFFFPLTKKKNSHTGEFGVSVHPQFQGLGIGKQLVRALLAFARQNERIEKVFLSVFASNTVAIALYNNLGFKEEGRHIKAVKQVNGDYVDVVQMYIHTNA
jgi:RimJ/RimL family protein N-acetyltransferase